MTPFSGMKDILFGYDTDIHFENGDLMQTTAIDWLEREVYKLLITSPGDWSSTRTMGCSPNQFIGELNTRENAKKIEDYIVNGLRDYITPAYSSVKVIPVSHDSLICLIDIYIEGLELTSIPFEFNFVNGFVKLEKNDTRVQEAISSETYKINNISNMTRPNKYYERIRNANT